MPPIDSGIENPVYHAPKKTDVQFQKSTPPTVKQFFSFLKQKSGKSSEQLKQDISKMINKQLNRGITLRELPPCLGYRTGVAPAKRMADETGYFDMVFYNPSDQKQVDYASSLGSIMIPYIAGNKVKATQRFRDANSPRAALAPLLGISCLPARLRKLKHKSINFLRLEEGLPPKLTAKGKKKVEELRKKNFMAAKANAEKEAAEKKAATEKQAIPKSAR
jgi:hypothetical protein